MIDERVEIQARINPPEGQERSGVPEPTAIFIYKDGTGRQVEERIGISIFDKSHLVERIIGEQDRLRKRLKQIPRQLEELSQKRKSGGGLYPKREKTQIRAQLEKEKEGISNKIERISETLGSLRTTISESNPFDPLVVEMSRKMAIKEIRGEHFPGEEDWWEFVRKKAPEVWDGGPQGERYQIAHALFIARWRLNRARLLSIQEEKNAEREFYEVTGSIQDETAEALSPIITKITNYFTAPKKG